MNHELVATQRQVSAHHVVLRDEKISRDVAAADIARRYRQWVAVFEDARTQPADPVLGPQPDRRRS